MIGVDLVPWLVGELAGFADDHPLFDMLVIDETSRLKDPSGKRARALLKVAGRFRTRWGLTGTPRPNSSQDLFMPAAIITDGALWGRAFVPWQKRHFRPRDPFGREWMALPGAEEQIAADFGTVAMTVADRRHARPAAAQHRGDACRAAGRRDGDLQDDAAGAVRRDRRRAPSRQSRRWSRPANAPSWPTAFSMTKATTTRLKCTRSKSTGCASWSRASTASRC